MAMDPALGSGIDAQQLTDDQWRSLLSPIEFAILRQSATERPGTGRYLHETGPGAYHCAGCGHHLYGSLVFP